MYHPRVCHYIWAVTHLKRRVYLFHQLSVAHLGWTGGQAAVGGHQIKVPIQGCGLPWRSLCGGKGRTSCFKNEQSSRNKRFLHPSSEVWLPRGGRTLATFLQHYLLLSTLPGFIRGEQFTNTRSFPAIMGSVIVFRALSTCISVSRRLEIVVACYISRASLGVLGRLP